MISAVKRAGSRMSRAGSRTPRSVSLTAMRGPAKRAATSSGRAPDSEGAPARTRSRGDAIRGNVPGTAAQLHETADEPYDAAATMQPGRIGRRGGAGSFPPTVVDRRRTATSLPRAAPEQQAPEASSAEAAAKAPIPAVKAPIPAANAPIPAATAPNLAAIVPGSAEALHEVAA